MWDQLKGSGNPSSPSQMSHQFSFKHRREYRARVEYAESNKRKIYVCQEEEKWSLHEHAKAYSFSRPIIFKNCKRPRELSMCTCCPRVCNKLLRLQAPTSDASSSSHWRLFFSPQWGVLIVYHIFLQFTLFLLWIFHQVDLQSLIIPRWVEEYPF